MGTCENFWRGWCPNCSYFVEIYIYIYSIYYYPSEATEDTCMFPGRQIKYNLPCSKIKKSFHPPALNALYFLLDYQWLFEALLIVVFESLNCPQCEKMDLKIIPSLLERVQICRRCWKTEDSAGHGGFFWRTALNLTVQNKTRDSWTTIRKQKTVMDHPGNHTVLRTKGSQTF